MALFIIAWQDLKRALRDPVGLVMTLIVPLVLIVANNQYAYSTPNSRQFACADLADKAVGYGVASPAGRGSRRHSCAATTSRSSNSTRTSRTR